MTSECFFEYRRILQDVCLQLDHDDSEWIRKAKRSRAIPFPYIRASAYKILRDVYSYGVQEIARASGHHHATVMHALDCVSQQPDYKDFFSKLKINDL